MALATELNVTNPDPLDLTLKDVKVQGQTLSTIENLLVLKVLHALDPRLSDGETWVDIVAKELLSSSENLEKESYKIFDVLLRAHLFPLSADAQNDYGRMTQQFEEDLVGAAVLRQAIATIFWAHVANGNSPFDLSAAAQSVFAIVDSVAPAFRQSEATLKVIARDVLDYVETQHALGGEPEKLFRSRVPKKP